MRNYGSLPPQLFPFPITFSLSYFDTKLVIDTVSTKQIAKTFVPKPNSAFDGSLPTLPSL